MYVFPSGSSIAACGYLLIQSGTAGSGGAALPVTPDHTAPMLLAAGAGKIALINNGTGGNPCAGHTVGGIYVDVVGFGGANCYETAPTVTLDNQSAAVRNIDGMTDSDDNSSDLTKVTSPVPHNSASPPNPACQITPTMSDTWGRLKTIYR
jgi:hypothetical protein